MARFGPETGRGGAGPLRAVDRHNGQSQSIEDMAFAWNPMQWVDKTWDWIGKQTWPVDIHQRTNASAGTPTVTIVDDQPHGEAACTLASNNESEYAGIDFADVRNTPGNKGFLFWCRAKVTALSSVQRAVIGVGDSFNATLESVGRHVWFTIAGGSTMSLTADTDDATNDRHTATGRTITAGTYYWYRIDARNVGAVEFWLDDTRVAVSDWSGINTTTLQPFIGVQKDSGAGTPTLTIDFLRLAWPRTS